MRDLRALGYIRDPKHKRTQKDARYLLGAAHFGAPPRVSDASLERHECQIMDQGATSSCTGHGTSMGLWVAMKSQGHELPFVPSQKGIYTVGRELGVVDPAIALSDSGAMPADVMAGISKVGVRPMGAQVDGRFSDCSIATINTKDTLDEIEEDVVHLIVGEYRIDETASDMVDQAAAAIAAGYPLGVGTFVDSAFEAWHPLSPPIGVPNFADSNGGGHWMCITSVREGADGRRIFRGPNSWGPGWGDQGHFEVSEAWLRAVWDLYVFSVEVTS